MFDDMGDVSGGDAVALNSVVAMFDDMGDVSGGDAVALNSVVAIFDDMDDVSGGAPVVVFGGIGLSLPHHHSMQERL